MIVKEDSIFTDTIAEDIHITGNAKATINGIVNGSVFVEDDSSLNLIGIVNKNVEVSEKASSEINGIVNGSVINLGGKVRICGIVSSIQGKPHSVLVEKDSIIGTKKMPASQMVHY